MRPALIAGAALVAGLLVPTPSHAATPQVQVKLPYNLDCIAPQGVLLADGDCDGGGNAFMDGPTVPTAGPVTLRGVTFQFPAHGTGELNSVVAVGQTIPAAGPLGERFVHLLAFGTDGTGAPTAGKITYADGTVTKVDIKAPDWTVTANTALDIAEQGPFNPGNALGGKNHAFIVSLPLNPSKRLASITLPNTPMPTETNFDSNPANLQVLAMTLATTGVKKSGPTFS